MFSFLGNPLEEGRYARDQTPSNGNWKGNVGGDVEQSLSFKHDLEANNGSGFRGSQKHQDNGQSKLAMALNTQISLDKLAHMILQVSQFFQRDLIQFTSFP